MSHHRMRFALAAIAALVASTHGHAQTGHNHHHASHRAAHVPAGVMFQHMHSKGEWMVDYRITRAKRSQLYYHSERISERQLQAAGFNVAPSSMTMQMHMLHVMYAVSDQFNVMLMHHYMSMDMSMNMLAMESDDHGHAGAMMAHEHDNSGQADPVLAALYRLYSSPMHSLHTTLAVSVPIGSVDTKGPDDHYLPYGMQIGSGTWDVLPSLSYNGHHGLFSWGGQVGASLPLESKNKSGFSRDESFYATAWGSHQTNDWLALSLRLQHDKSGEISGHYDGPHNHGSPQDRQANYGGEIWSAGIGATFTVPPGPLANQQIAVEWTEQIAAHHRGYQLGDEKRLVVAFSIGF